MSNQSCNVMGVLFLNIVLLLGAQIPAARGHTRLVPSEYPTIQAGIDAAEDGDEVVVADGVYTGDGNRDLDFGGKIIRVRSENGAETCIIDCQGSEQDPYRGFYFHSNEIAVAVVQGFTIRNGYAGRGGGIHCQPASPTISMCTFEGNGSASAGGGFYSRNGSPTIRSCTFIGNTSGGTGGGAISCWDGSAVIQDCDLIANAACGIGGSGGGVLFASSGSPTVEGCTIRGNTADWNGGGVGCIGSARGTVSNCVIEGNSAWVGGGGVYCSGQGNTPAIVNCTIVNNEQGGIWTESASPTFTNCIVWGNTPVQIYNFSPNLGVFYSDVQGGWPGEGNIGDDPAFAFPDDYHLLSDSPCIDAGTNDPRGGLPSNDLDGNLRALPEGETVDMGVYEFNAESPSIALAPQEFVFIALEGGADPEAQILSIRNGGGSTLNWEVLPECNWLEPIPPNGESIGEIDEIALLVDIAGLDDGEHTCRLTISDDQAVNSPRQVLVTLYVASSRRVPAEYLTIQSAIDASVPGDTILLADGIYTGSGNKDLDFGAKAITVRSVNGAETCIIDCEGTGRGFYFLGGGTDAVVEGITITGGFARFGAAIWCGGSSPTIRDCIIRGNSATAPGGGTGGGGIACVEANPTLINCTIVGNVTRNNGGAIYCTDGAPIITNCSISGNTAGQRGGGMYFVYGSNPQITNCILWADRAPGGDEIYMQGGDRHTTVTVAYSDVEGGEDGVLVSYDATLIWGNGNIDADPVFAFVDDYHLIPGSPCIDAATAGPPGGLPPADRDGNARPLDGNGGGFAIPDMGSHEFNPDVPSIAFSPHSTEFFAAEGGANPDDQILRVRNCGGETLNWQVEPGCGWLLATPSIGESSGEIDEITLRADVAGQVHGIHDCSVTISDDEAINSPRSQFVKLNLRGILRVPQEYEVIQDAIDAAVVGQDVVLIADGTYTGPGNKNLDTAGKSMIVRSANGAENCIIDCEGDGRGFYFHSGEGRETVVSGLTITNGSADEGGGIYCDESDPTIAWCVITQCSADSSGGGISCGYSSNPAIVNCRILANTAPVGGGIDLLGYGPGVPIRDCTISNNTATWGGGISSYYSSPLIANCTVTSNTASGAGGGVYFESDGVPIVLNSLLWGNRAPNGPQMAIIFDTHLWSCPEPTVAYSDVEGGQGDIYNEDDCPLTWGDGNIDADPLFVDPNGPDNDPDTWEDNDFRLTADSPCINAGDPNYVPDPGETDLDAHSRILCDRVDMGAYEFGIGDFDCNRLVDLFDFEQWLTCFTGPDGGPIAPGCEAFDTNADGDVDWSDFATIQLAFIGD